MSITLHGTPTRQDIASPAASVAITLPTGTASTDVVIAILGSDLAGTNVGTYTAPSGWTAIFTHKLQAGTASSVDLAGFWALGNIANLTFTRSGSVGDLGVLVSAWSGVDNTTPTDVTPPAAVSNTGSSSISAPSNTPATTGAVKLIAFADWTDGNPSATGMIALQNGSGGGAAANSSAYLLYDLTSLTSGVATGATSVSDSGSTTGQILVAASFLLRPAGGGGTFTWQQLTQASDFVRQQYEMIGY